MDINHSDNIDDKLRLSQRQKRASNSKWYELNADKIASTVGYNTDSVKERFKTNYNIYNGKGKLEDFNDYITLSAFAKEGIDIGLTRHYDILSSIASSMVGDEAKRPFNPLCVDISPTATTQIKQKRLELVQKYIQETIIAPIQQQVQQEIQSQIPLDEDGNPQISEEEQQQIQEQMSQQVESMTLPEIKQYMKKTFRSSGSNAGQKILNWVIRNHNMKFYFNEAFKNLIITGLPVMTAPIYNGKLEVHLVNPLNFDYGGGKGKFAIQDADWWKHEEDITIAELFRRHGKELSKSDISKIDDSLSSYSINDYDDSNLINEYVRTEDGRHIDIMTPEGQSIMANLKSRARSGAGYKAGNQYVRYVHTAWRALAKYKEITRVHPDTGDEMKVIRSEHYKYSPETGDLKETEFWIPQLYETIVIESGGEKIYIRKQPIKNQYNSLNDVYNVSGPYYGFAWGSFYGNSDFVAPLDKAKPTAYDYNVIRSKINKIISKDKGRILTLYINQKPAQYTTDQWMELINEEGFMVMDSTDSRGFDAQGLKTLDLTNMQDLTSKLNYLNYLKEEATNAMSYNSSRLGQISPYMTATNNQQNIIQSMSQTEDIYSTFNLFKEQFLTHLVRQAKIAYLEDPTPLSYVLDDYSIAELSVDSDTLEMAELAVYVSNDTTDVDNLLMSKSLLQSMASSGAITFTELMKSIWSKSGIESLNIAEQAEERRQMEQQQQQQHEKQMVQQQADAAQQQMQNQQQFELTKLELEYEYKLRMAELDSLKFANQYDIDRDNINDTNERQEIELATQVKENQKDRDAELQRLREELKAKKEIAKISTKKINK